MMIISTYIAHHTLCKGLYLSYIVLICVQFCVIKHGYKGVQNSGDNSIGNFNIVTRNHVMIVTLIYRAPSVMM